MTIKKQGWTLWYQDGRGEVYAKELIRSSQGEQWVVELFLRLDAVPDSHLRDSI